MNQPSSSPGSTPSPAGAPPRSAARLRVAVIAAGWHREIVDAGVDAIRAGLEQGGVAPAHIALYRVPGAFEIPLHAQRLALSGSVDAIVACALVVNGGIYRHEFVASAVIDGLMRVQLEADVPVISAVLTPRDFHDHDEHRRFFREHFTVKGAEAAQACLQTLTALAALPIGAD